MAIKSLLPRRAPLTLFPRSPRSVTTRRICTRETYPSQHKNRCIDNSACSWVPQLRGGASRGMPLLLVSSPVGSSQPRFDLLLLVLSSGFPTLARDLCCSDMRSAPTTNTRSEAKGKIRAVLVERSDSVHTESSAWLEATGADGPRTLIHESCQTSDVLVNDVSRARRFSELIHWRITNNLRVRERLCANQWRVLWKAVEHVELFSLSWNERINSYSDSKYRDIVVANLSSANRHRTCPIDVREWQ